MPEVFKHNINMSIARYSILKMSIPLSLLLCLLIAFIFVGCKSTKRDLIGEVITLANQRQYNMAIDKYNEAKDTYRISASEDLEMLRAIRGRSLSAGSDFFAIINLDGSVSAFGDNSFGQCNTYYWEEIVRIAAGGGHILGLKSNGDLVSSGLNDFGQTDISSWENIIEITAGKWHSLGLKSDGTVVSTQDPFIQGLADLGKRKDISFIACGDESSLFVDELGHAYYSGETFQGAINPSQLKDIMTCDAGDSTSFWLKSSGKVVVLGPDYYSTNDEVKSWKNVVSIASGQFHIVALLENGDVKAAGKNNYGQIEVGAWENVVAITAGDNFTIGLKADGTLLAAGRFRNAQIDVDEFNKANSNH